jgi:hypothetical protein
VMLAAEHSVNLLPFLLAHQCRVRQCQVDGLRLALSLAVKTSRRKS